MEMEKEIRERKASSKKQKEDDCFNEIIISKKHQAKWKPIAETSLAYTRTLLDQTVMDILNKTETSEYDTVQDHLNALKTRIIRRLEQEKVPLATFDYNDLDTVAMELEERVSKTDSQVHLLDDKIEREEKLMSKKKDEISFYRTTMAKPNARKLHPLLERQYRPVLNLPELPDMSHPIKLCTTLSMQHIEQNTAVQKFTSNAAAIADNLR